MAKNKFYAVRKGVVPGIYSTWDECRNQVVGYSGAEYKGFKAKEEAESFMGTTKIDIIKDKNNKETVEQKPYKRMDAKAISLSNKSNSISIYTDGGWGNKEDGGKMYAGAFLILKEGEIVHKMCVNGDEEGLAELRNVAGEMQAVVRAMHYVANNKELSAIKNIYIFVDYVGLMHWSIPKSQGGWKRKNEYTNKYGDYMEKMRERYNIEFFHVKGHNNDPFNEEVDCLASYSKKLYFDKKEYCEKEFQNNHSYLRKNA